MIQVRIIGLPKWRPRWRWERRWNLYSLIQPDGEAVKVGESYMKVQYFKYDALLVENGRKFTIFNLGVSDVI